MFRSHLRGIGVPQFLIQGSVGGGLSERLQPPTFSLARFPNSPYPDARNSGERLIQPSDASLSLNFHTICTMARTQHHIANTTCCTKRTCASTDYGVLYLIAVLSVSTQLFPRNTCLWPLSEATTVTQQRYNSDTRSSQPNSDRDCTTEECSFGP